MILKKENKALQIIEKLFNKVKEKVISFTVNGDAIDFKLKQGAIRIITDFKESPENQYNIIGYTVYIVCIFNSDNILIEQFEFLGLPHYNDGEIKPEDYFRWSSMGQEFETDIWNNKPVSKLFRELYHECNRQYYKVDETLDNMLKEME